MKELDLQSNKFGERLRKVREAKGMRVVDFYTPITRHVSNCSAIEHFKRPVGKRLLDDVISHYHVNPAWMYDGEGEMFDETNVDESVPAPYERGVPFFNVNMSEIAFGEYGLFNDAPEYYVNYRPFNDCDAYLPIYGDSMYPRYASGEIIAVREIQNFNVIQWGEAYLVIADDLANNMTTVKLLFEHPDEKKIVLRSSNPNFKGDTVVDRSCIKRMFLVKGKVTRNQL
ncbi:S24 family peptidase [Pedobacter nyackensis]|uniref:Phage repressor protein C, contains Cro/C1-type HTH and peptisase s24 domains n=1 Tax=Pedobacter nyackensis TaxID=475255 RepID=A0A1W2B6Z3_9SPHI|nr:S24 family peptidase [Pedobacter nyackensis]SMC68706.1 Phage repressor protein C, contains Cro/C1-type HTH and peptisase s24 domains [Pedobacter nyackensis]